MTVVAHRDAFAYERMSTRYQGAHSVADFIAKFRATPHLSKTTETIDVFATEGHNDDKHGHIKGRVGEPGFENLTWEADVVNEVGPGGEDRWRCDSLTVDGVTFR